MKFLVSLSRYFVGILFIFSGLIKLNDPVGFSYKLNDYFAEDVLNLPFLVDYALLLALFVVIYEIILGVMLLIGYLPKFTVWNLLLMIIFFTFLTFYSAYFNKVTDCGCFGDAIPFTPWQSFTKDVVLLALIVFLFKKNKYIKPHFKKRTLRLTVLTGIFICLGITYYVLTHLPIIDFRAYKIGTNIEEGMSIPEGAPASVYEDVWYYRVQGKVNTYSTEDAPWNIPGSEFVDRKTTEISKGYEPPIHDFTMELDGTDYTDDYLSAEKAVLIIAYNLGKSDKEGLATLEAFHHNALSKGYKVAGLTASLEDDIKKIKKNNHLSFEFYACDETALKTIIRSNPGVLVLNKGTISQKVNWKDIDSLEL